MEPAVDSDSPIFIVGCPRSGNTLLRNMLCSHPHLAFPDESHFIPAFYRGFGHPANGSEARRLAKNILRLAWVRRWDLDLAPEEFESCRAFREVVAQLYTAWARKQGRRRWGDKTPQYVTEMPVLVELFPAARIVHMIRDGRDVALSWLRTRLEPRNLYTAARLWKERVTAGRVAGSHLPSAMYLEVRYETLLREPEAVMRTICAFIGEPYDDIVLSPSLGGLIPAHGKASLLLRNEVVRTNAGKWKTAMPPSSRILFESVAGELLSELGYETEGRVRRITAPERRFWELHHAAKWLMRRLEIQRLRKRLMTYVRIKGAELRSR